MGMAKFPIFWKTGERAAYGGKMADSLEEKGLI
jgi:hypothetical protein